MRHKKEEIGAIVGKVQLEWLESYKQLQDEIKKNKALSAEDSYLDFKKTDQYFVLAQNFDEQKIQAFFMSEFQKEKDCLLELLNKVIYEIEYLLDKKSILILENKIHAVAAIKQEFEELERNNQKNNLINKNSSFSATYKNAKNIIDSIVVTGFFLINLTTQPVASFGGNPPNGKPNTPAVSIQSPKLTKDQVNIKKLETLEKAMLNDQRGFSQGTSSRHIIRDSVVETFFEKIQLLKKKKGKALEKGIEELNTYYISTVNLAIKEVENESFYNKHSSNILAILNLIMTGISLYQNRDKKKKK